MIQDKKIVKWRKYFYVFIIYIVLSEILFLFSKPGIVEINELIEFKFKKNISNNEIE